MDAIHMTPRENPLVASVCRAAFPDYVGKKLALRYTDAPLDLRSFWSDGSRTFWAIVRLSDMACIQIPQQSPFDAAIPGIAEYTLPVGTVAVAHTIFCGNDAGLTIYARTDGTKLLAPDKPELTEAEKLVLIATRSLKSSYAGISDYRKHELTKPREAWDSHSRLTPAQVDAARIALRTKKLLDARNALTNAGRNAAAGLGFWD